ncbi:MAG: DNA polymerase III subunit delta [Planctomycetota bacterium]|nr:DNA polymerase III subunit delta [Planctomycetota bacterium]
MAVSLSYYGRAIPHLRVILMAKTAALTGLKYLSEPDKHPAAAVCVVYGDEPFLKRMVLDQLRTQIAPDDDADFSFSVKSGELIEQPREIFDELRTVALFGGRRVVLIEGADKLVTDFRSKFEDYVDRPSSSGLLILEVKTWPATTRLYKAVDKTGLQIECKTPSISELSKWIRTRCKKEHGVEFEPAALDRLLDIIGPDMGRLDSETAKLAPLVFASAEKTGGTAKSGGKITPELVDQHVGGWQTVKAWAMIDLALEGKTAAALKEFDRLVLSGEEPIALLAMTAGSMRKLAAATRWIEDAEASGRSLGLRQALELAGIPKWPDAIQRAERQLMHLGRHRAGPLFRRVLEADLSLKGSHSAKNRTRLVMEELILSFHPPRQASASQRR